MESGQSYERTSMPRAPMWTTEAEALGRGQGCLLDEGLFPAGRWRADDLDVEVGPAPRCDRVSVNFRAVRIGVCAPRAVSAPTAAGGSRATFARTVAAMPNASGAASALPSPGCAPRGASDRLVGGTTGFATAPNGSSFCPISIASQPTAMMIVPKITSPTDSQNHGPIRETRLLMTGPMRRPWP